MSFEEDLKIFPTYFPLTIIRLRPERHLLADLHPILHRPSLGHTTQLWAFMWYLDSIL